MDPGTSDGGCGRPQPAASQACGRTGRALGPVLLEHRRITRLLLLWTLTIVVLPFPTALVASSADQPATQMLYVGTITVSTALIALIEVVVRRHPEVADGFRPDLRPVLLALVALLVALALMLLVPSTGYYPMLLLALLPAATRVLQRRGHREVDQADGQPAR